ncbi:MAG TPA: KpsF/GutQ family sugar-phosphate isomerase [Longimicrobiales bacterium]|nr:KpsF/GutQ family sugar-phosphate isomerase [Longimicrobiales bacterium]
MALEVVSTVVAPPLGDVELLDRARAVVRAEAEALAVLEHRIGDAFLESVRLVAEARGRVVVSGVGKSGIIGRKIAATLTSTGTPATFLHPVEGLHGDLGIVGAEDVAILISKSGESEELGALLGYLARLGVPVVAMTGRTGSSLARAARVVLDCSVAQEACPFDLAPTTSTTVTAALGDALAVALLLRKGFTREDFARLHPGGALGRKLTLRVGDLMLTQDIPWLGVDGTMRECVVLLAEKRGTVPILDDARRVVGVVTAGDLTRLMEREADFMAVPVVSVMTRSPKLCEAELLAAAAVHQMETFGIMALPVVDAERRLIGIVHLHDLLRAGAV